MTVKLAEKQMSPADQKWGYRFGADGLMSLKETREFLSMSDDTIARLADAGKIRRGKNGENGWSMYCRRSVTEYASSLEV